MFPLNQPWFLLLIPLGIVAIAKLVRQKSALGFSSAALLRGVGAGIPLLHIEQLLLALFVIANSLILAQPIQQVKHTVPIYAQARDIIIVLDISGSMTADRILTAKKVISTFVAKRPQDRIALIVFQTDAYLEWPLSLDHDTLIYRLSHTSAGGGTRIASGIIAGLKHQQQYGKNPAAIIMVSDGGSEVTPAEKSAIEASLGQTKFHWIWIYEVEDPQARSFGLYVTSLGGKVYQGGIDKLEAIFAEIDRLETSSVVYDQQVSVVYQFGPLPVLALTSLFLAGLIDILREV